MVVTSAEQEPIAGPIKCENNELAKQNFDQVYQHSSKGMESPLLCLVINSLPNPPPPLVVNRESKGYNNIEQSTIFPDEPIAVISALEENLFWDLEPRPIEEMLRMR